MNTHTEQEILSRVQSIRPLPAAVVQLCRLTKNLESDCDEIVRIISMDEALATRMLRVANSAFYGFTQRVNTISQAVLLLGFQGVRSLALSVSVMDMRIGMSLKNLSREDMWRHSLAVATVSRDMADYLHVGESEEAFLGGLLHDIGKIIIMEVFPEKYEQVVNQSRIQMVPLFELEKMEFGTDHAQIGAALCDRWKIPALFGDIVSKHHQHVADWKKADGMVFLVQVGDGLAKMAQTGADGDENIPVHVFEAMNSSDFPLEYIRRLEIGLPEQINKASVFFDIPSHDAPPVQRRNPDGMLVLMRNDGERELIQVALLSMGFQLLTLREAQKDEENLAGVITDESLLPMHPKIRQICIRRELPILNFADWQSQGLPPGRALLHVSRFKEWIAASMISPEDESK